MGNTDGKGRETPEEFLSRWSRRKQAARAAPPAPAAAPPANAPAETAAPPLPPVESLTPDSDFTAFLHPKVDEGLRRAALKKLFSDPHFNVMDGLDTYIDDYSVSEPIPEAMLQQLRHAQDIIQAGKERREEAAKAEAAQRETAETAETAALPAASDSGIAHEAAVPAGERSEAAAEPIDRGHSHQDSDRNNHNNAKPRA